MCVSFFPNGIDNVPVILKPVIKIRHCSSRNLHDDMRHSKILYIKFLNICLTLRGPDTLLSKSDFQSISLCSDSLYYRYMFINFRILFLLPHLSWLYFPIFNVSPKVESYSFLNSIGRFLLLRGYSITEDSKKGFDIKTLTEAIKKYTNTNSYDV